MRDEAGGTVVAAVPLNSPSWWVQTGDCTSPHYIMRGGAAWQQGSSSVDSPLPGAAYPSTLTQWAQ